MALASIIRTTGILKICRYSKIFPNLLTEKCAKITQPCLGYNVQLQKFFVSEKKQKGPNKQENSTSPEGQKKGKPLESPPILLITPENKVSSVSLEEAEKLARSKKLKLVKIVDFDTKSDKPVYKLMTNFQFFEEENKNKKIKKKEKNSSLKEDKMFTFNTKITDNDLYTRIKQTLKLLKRRHPVNILISIDGNQPRTDEIISMFEKELSGVISKSKKIDKNRCMKLELYPKIELESEEKMVDSSDKETLQSEEKIINTNN